MNTYRKSDGSKVKQSTIDRKVREAKRQKIAQVIMDYGYVCCEECGVSSGTYFDCSHDISVDKCKKMGRTELAWDVDNITLRCRKHHNEHDKTN